MNDVEKYLLPLKWFLVKTNVWVASVGLFDVGHDNDGIRFELQYFPTNYRRGSWKLFVEVLLGPFHHNWGCFDDQDCPIRYFHKKENAESEADCIAEVLVHDRIKYEMIGDK